MSLALIAWLCVVWAFFLSVGQVALLNWPTGLIILGTILYIVSDMNKNN